MSSADFQDRLQRLLAGELPEEEARQLHEEIRNDPQALEEYLANRELDHELRRLLAPGSSDEAFLRGVLNARSADRKDPEEFLKSVTRTHAQRAHRKPTRRTTGQERNWVGIAVLAAGLLVAAVWMVTSPAKKGEPEQVRKAEPRREETPSAPREPIAPIVPEPPRPQEAPTVVDRVPPPEVKPSPEVPKPLPKSPEPEAPAPPPPKPPVQPTRTAVATIEKTKGDVFVYTASPAEKSPASEGQALAPGQGVFTEGAQSSVVVSQINATRLTLGVDTRIRFADAAPEIALFQGKLDVEAKDVFVTTPHAEVRVQESRLTLTTTPASTRLAVHQGAALFTNVWDGKQVQVKAGNQAVAQAPAGIDLKRVDDALRKGIAYLRTAPSTGIEDFRIANCDELILLTLLSAGIPESDALVQKLVSNILSAPLAKTYLVSLQAMALEELDRVKHQNRIAECAQFLVDNQCTNGQWTYDGERSPVTIAAELPSEVATGGTGQADLFGRRSKPKIGRRIQIKKTRTGPPQGDNSNAQYAALGLRACFEAGVTVPAEALQLAAGWWRKCQYPDPSGRGTASGEGLLPRGWCYNDGKNPVNGGPCCVGPYASMTAGAVSSLMIYDHLLGADWKKDVSVRTGISWMSAYFTVSRNLGMDLSFKAVNGGTTPPESYLYYSLYALERVGIFSGQEKLGRHAWYADGAKHILSKQKADGSWNEASESSRPTWDTCFAILFLRRATRPLDDVPSVDRSSPKDK